MDVRSHQPRERVFSILNDNDSPSFQIPCRRGARSRPEERPSSRQDRPNLQRLAKFRRTSSISSTISSSISGSLSPRSSCNSPVLQRLDSADLVSRSSGDSMDSSPSPATPAYGYPDVPLAPYDAVIRPDGIPSSANVTPFLEQQMMVGAAPSLAQQAPAKQVDGLAPIPPFAIIPTPGPLAQPDLAQLTVSAASNNPPPPNPPSTGKKNKYPCPYAQSHNCVATFTTSGHAARHGKKHTGEKGVHCPICNKAFTRKDNMKQHARTHKESISVSGTSDGLNARRPSKALVTREAQKNRSGQQDSLTSDPAPQTLPLMASPLSQSTSGETSKAALPVGYEDVALFPEPVNASIIPTVPLVQNVQQTNPVYPGAPLAGGGDGLQIVKPPKVMNNGLPSMAPLARGLTDLDTLAQAAENFDPYYLPVLEQQQPFQRKQ